MNSGMIRKYCASCHRDNVWHNAMKGEGQWRCTFCGSPVTTNPGKREHWENIRKQQAAKPK